MPPATLRETQSLPSTHNYCPFHVAANVSSTPVRVRRGDWRTHLVPRGRGRPGGGRLQASRPSSPPSLADSLSSVEVCGYKVDLSLGQRVQPALRARSLASSLALVRRLRLARVSLEVPRWTQRVIVVSLNSRGGGRRPETQMRSRSYTSTGTRHALGAGRPPVAAPMAPLKRCPPPPPARTLATPPGWPLHAMGPCGGVLPKRHPVLTRVDSQDPLRLLRLGLVSRASHLVRNVLR